MYESPFWVGWSAGSWGTSWGYDSGGDPIEVWDWKLEPAGHWKHLFTPAYGVTTPAVTAKCTPAYRIALPDVARISIPAETRSVSARHTPRFRVAAPFVGTVTVQVGEECGSAFRVVKPRCGGQTFYGVRCSNFSRVAVVKPSTGCATRVEIGFIRHYGTVLRPSTIQNPTEEMMMALW